MGTVGKEILDQVNDRLRKLVDNSQNVQGFIIHHAVGGGTGSGLGALILDNEAIYQICQKQLDVDRPSYADLNMLISKVISSMTASLRFDGELNVDLGEFQTNLVPFPRLHFMTTALAPVISKKKASHEAQTVREITDHSFQSQNMLVKYAEFDPVEDKYMAISINYRGDIKSKEANATVQWLKQNNKISFVEWCPTGFKIGLNEVPAASVEGDITAPTK